MHDEVFELLCRWGGWTLQKNEDEDIKHWLPAVGRKFRIVALDGHFHLQWEESPGEGKVPAACELLQALIGEGAFAGCHLPNYLTADRTAVEPEDAFLVSQGFVGGAPLVVALARRRNERVAVIGRVHRDNDPRGVNHGGTHGNED